MPASTFSIEDLLAKVGEPLGQSEWRRITQEQVNTFADATDDHQWIHVDTERAAAGPFKAPIAHGYLTLSLIVPMFSEVLEVSGISMAVNYGLNKARFPAPVPVGSRIRLGATLAGAEEVTGGIQILVDVVIELDGGTKPVCVAQVVYRYYR
jgi:acyl dehydratase